MNSMPKCILLVFLWGFNTSAQAAPKVPVPDQIPGVQLVDAEGVIEVAGKFKKMIIIDSRIAGDRKLGYIEHSISLPDTETNCDSLAKIIPSKRTPTLLYCNGVKCGRVVVATRIAVECGYENLYWFRGGFEEWKLKEYPFVSE